MTLSLGIDIGTSGVRMAVLSADGQVLSTARAGHPPQPDAGRIDATLWWDAVRERLSQQVAALRATGLDPADITGIAVDGTSGSMVLTGTDLAPVGPALMYNSKGFVDEAAAIARYAPDPHITRGSNSALARAMRLLAIADAPPAHLMHQADFIAAKLRGTGGMSDHTNALKTGYDPETETWPDWVDAVFPARLLPDVQPVGTPLGDIDPQIASQFGLDRRVTIHAGTTDSVAAFLACAPLKAGVAVTSLGSTLAIKVLSDRRIDDPGIGLYSHKVGAVWLVGGASNTGGAVLSHFFSPRDLDRLSARIDPATPTGLDYYPLLRPGERFPVNDPEFSGRMDPRPDQDHLFLSALLEGIAAVEHRCYREIERRGGGYPTHVYSAGGGARNAVFSAIRATALGVEVARADQDEAAVGVASLARGSTGSDTPGMPRPDPR